MSRVYNFSAGPAMLPEEVLVQAKEEMLNWHGLGSSVMEISHRSSEFKTLAQETVQDVKALLHIPDNYHVLFLHGGARSQFAMVPMNLLPGFACSAHIKTGIWSEIAMLEAELYGKTHLVTDSEPLKYTTIAEQSSWNFPEDAAYLHYVDNETINGLEFTYIPESHGVPLVCDMSSNILSRPFDITQFGIVYACAQKNLGPAGVTLVIIHDDLLQRRPFDFTPRMFQYQLHAKADSMYNTSPTYPWYIAGLVLKWLKRQGGVAAIAKVNAAKAKKLYDFIDQNDFYANPVDKKYRSRMNVIFNLQDENLNEQFLTQAKQAGLTGLKGHRYIGGMRASIYNAMPEKGVDTLIEFMQDFAKKM